MNRRVIYARLQTAGYLPSVGDLGLVFPSQTKTMDNLIMTSTPDGLHVQFSYRGFNKELLIPPANVVLMELAPEEKKKPKAE